MGFNTRAREITHAHRINHVMKLEVQAYEIALDFRSLVSDFLVMERRSNKTRLVGPAEFIHI